MRSIFVLQNGSCLTITLTCGHPAETPFQSELQHSHFWCIGTDKSCRSSCHSTLCHRCTILPTSQFHRLTGESCAFFSSKPNGYSSSPSLSPPNSSPQSRQERKSATTAAPWSSPLMASSQPATCRPRRLEPASSSRAAPLSTQGSPPTPSSVSPSP